MSKQFWLVVVAIVVVLGGIFFLTNSGAQGGGGSGQPSHNVEGLGLSHVALVEYGDYECPFCGEYSQTLTQLEPIYNNDITFQFVDFPLVSIHQNAFAGARAAEAAAMQGKFWQMHNLLYEENQIYYASNQTSSTWINAGDPLPVFDKYAAQIGLNVSKFNTDYASNQVNATINDDMAKGNKLNVNATPTFYLDGKQIQVNNSLSAFEKVLNAAIHAHGGKIPAAAATAGASFTPGTTTQTKK